ncbi:MAG: hypothetical protein GY827_07280 [Cytophagales bacterium]|nr:hypothetical protein [Cytophagales bacterium]
MFKGLGLVDTIILVLATGFFFIGVSQIILVGFAGSYWIFMLTFILLFLFQHRKSAAAEKKRQEEEEQKQNMTSKKKKNKKTKKK